MTNKHRILIVFFILTFSTVVAFLFHRPIKVSYNQGMAAETSSLTNLTACAGRAGNDISIGGNITEATVAYSGTNQYITYFSNDNPSQVLITKYNGTSCETPVRVNTTAYAEPGSESHNAPAVYVDGQGYIYVAYMGSQIYSINPYGGDPFMRRSTFPHNITSWQPEVKMRFANWAEMTGNTLADGAVMFVAHSGAPAGGMIDIIEPGGTYRWSAARQVVSNGKYADPIGNKFMKTIFEPSPTNPNRIYVTWGWACGGSPGDGTPDCTGYSQDSHEVFFAYTDDGGVTWKNKNNTKTVTAALCPPSITYCHEEPGLGIAHNDPAFILTNTHQREQRAIWEDPDGTIYLAFTKSVYTSPPGALMMLKFTLGGSVQEITVSSEPHYNVAGIRKEGSNIYIWTALANSYRVYEYVSTNGGSSWQRTDLIGADCPRLQGNTIMLARNMVSMVCQVTSGSASDVYYYQKTFSGGVNPPPPGPVPPPPGPVPPPPPGTISATPSSVVPGGTFTVVFNNPSSTTTDWIGLYTPGSPNGPAIDWKYTNSCTQNAGGTPLSSGSCTFSISSNGTYEFRLEAQDEFALIGTSNPVSVAAPAVKGWWKLDGNTSDSSGNGLNGTVLNGPVYVSGKLGSALSFDGINDYVDLGSPASLNIQGALSMSAWINPSSSIVGEALLINGDYKYGLTYYSDGNLYFYIGSGGNSIGAPVSANTWHHVAATWDGTANPNGMKLYVDGVLVSQRASVLTSTGAAGPIHLGRNGTDYYKGLVDEVRIYNYALTPSEVQTLAVAPLPGDFNVDHIINSLDWSYMNSKWFTNDVIADLDSNGLVNSLDFSIMNSNWFKTW